MSKPPSEDYVRWLEGQSMLRQAQALAGRYPRRGRFWQRPFAEAQPRMASTLASAWFTAYPPSIITRPGGSVLETLSDPELWEALAEIGIDGVHTGPMKQTGGLHGREHTPSVDGSFDRIGFAIDPLYGTERDYLAMTRVAAAHDAIIIDDVIPAHTGKGADFRLAELGFEEFPGLYHMVDVAPEHWHLLPPVPEGRDAVNLPTQVVDRLKAEGYIVGQLRRVIFFEPGVKETDWSATAVVTGVDGVARRWVYLHYFKQGQPSLNWLDPSFGAQRMIVGDALHSLDTLGARGLRLDANGFLGIEVRATGPAWSEGHPLSVLGSQIIAGMVRKAGGFTFQELNLTVDDIAAMSKGGADLSYDFITRPAYHHALTTGSTAFLRLMLRTVHQHGVDPASLVHALQNHDELTLELVHFWTTHADDSFTLGGETLSGRALRDQVRHAMYGRLTGQHAAYNLPFVTNGIAGTTVSFIAAALGIADLDRITPEDRQLILRVHLLLVMYNAFQPGVVALSGWDLVGALPLPPGAVVTLMADGDTRWIQRGAYDLLDVDPGAGHSSAGLPRARSLYGSLRQQLREPGSFACEVKHLLAVRRAHGIARSIQLDVPEVSDPALLVMVHQLPDGGGTQLTALNFGPAPVAEAVHLAGAAPGLVVDMLEETVLGELPRTGLLSLSLAPYEGKSLRVGGKTPAGARGWTGP